jgi:hypothetical protein
MRFWVYFKGSNNGELFVGYRYAIGDSVVRLTSSSALSCATNATDCSWKRVDLSLDSILSRPTEVRRETTVIEYLLI